MVASSIIHLGSNTTDNDTINLTTNNTTNTTTENQTNTQDTQKTQKTQKTTEKKSTSNDEVTYDEQLNVYFDKDGKTAYDGQVPKGTSKEELQKQSKISQQDFN